VVHVFVAKDTCASACQICISHTLLRWSWRTVWMVGGRRMGKGQQAERGRAPGGCGRQPSGTAGSPRPRQQT
jgi:hypothetical protein